MQLNAPFLFVALVTLTAAAAAMRLRNLVHCALCAAAAFAGLAIAYLLLGAEFVALAQALIYVGAVAILIVFGIMLTRGAEIAGGAAIAAPKSWMGFVVAALLCGLLICAALGFPNAQAGAPEIAAPSVRQIGLEMMANYIPALEGVGLLLTAALIGAVVIAMREPAQAASRPEPDEPVAVGSPRIPPLELQSLDRL